MHLFRSAARSVRPAGFENGPRSRFRSASRKWNLIEKHPANQLGSAVNRLRWLARLGCCCCRHFLSVRFADGAIRSGIRSLGKAARVGAAQRFSILCKHFVRVKRVSARLVKMLAHSRVISLALLSGDVWACFERRYHIQFQLGHLKKPRNYCY